MTDPQLEAEALEAARADYVDDWIRGNLYDDGEVYSRPIEKLAETDLLPGLVTARDDDELLRVAKELREELFQCIASEMEEIDYE